MQTWVRQGSLLFWQTKPKPKLEQVPQKKSPFYWAGDSKPVSCDFVPSFSNCLESEIRYHFIRNGMTMNIVVRDKNDAHGCHPLASGEPWFLQSPALQTNLNRPRFISEQRNLNCQIIGPSDTNVFFQQSCPMSEQKTVFDVSNLNLLERRAS